MAVVVVVIALAASCLLRLPAVDMPLNRDEAAYALIGDQASLHRLPYGRWRAAAAALGAMVVGATTYVEGYDLNTEHLVVLTGSATVLLSLVLQRSRSRRVPALVGLLGGVAVITKAVFVTMVPATLIPLLAARHLRRQSLAGTTARFGLGLAAVPVAVLALFAAPGAGGDFLDANVTLNRAYVAAAPDRWALSGRLLPLREYRREVCRQPPRFLVLTGVDSPEPCLDLTRYGTLSDLEIPGGRVKVLILR